MERLFLRRFIPEQSVGVELGVFTGLFSSYLARLKRARKISFVDPWWEIYGEHYPDWGLYTDRGRLSTRVAHQIASARIAASGLAGREVVVAQSYDWLQSLPDASLDWVYLDSTHGYEGTRKELALIAAKLAPRGVIMGDDWRPDITHPHFGVFQAVNEFVRENGFEFVLCGRNSQWVIRRKTAKFDTPKNA